jgi:asparagine synthase (glutamine-hydrolysing)
MFQTIRHRGPDESRFLSLGDEDVTMGFHRLSINGLDAESGQPMLRNGVYLLCNGEIFNYKEIAEKYAITLETGSDCEIILRLFFLLDRRIHDVCAELEGDFAFVLYDSIAHEIYIGRDPLGIRSLYIGVHEKDLFVASEKKAIPGRARQVCPGTVTIVSDREKEPRTVLYRRSPLPVIRGEIDPVTEIRRILVQSVKRRMLSDRPIGCILSGGLDSTIITAIVARLLKDTGTPLHTYTIGLPGSTDLVWARKAADFLGTIHHEFIVTEKEFLDFIPPTIAQIESFDVTTVRASTANYLLCVKIAQTTSDKVLFCGDVSDELFASYRGFQDAPSPEAFQQENNAMLRNIHFFDVLRADKSFAGAGLEARVPYADRDFVDLVMSLPPHLKMFSSRPGDMEKKLLRQAFEEYLPEDLLWRRKEAFSDGVSGCDRSWFQIIQEHVEGKKDLSDASIKAYEYITLKYITPFSKESLWYREIFEEHFPGHAEECIPYFWRHPFSEQEDPSARLLKQY